ncbi:hypothetical protein SCALM49S_08084 [Streptomyces californicus]
MQFLPAARLAHGTGHGRRGPRDTALCGRFGQHVLAGTHWKAPSGRWYVLAARDRAVTRIEAKGAVRGAADGTAFAVRAPRDAEVELTAAVRRRRHASGRY